MEGENVLLLMADDKGRPDEAVHYVASPGFMTAVRVWDSGSDNLEMLCGDTGWELGLFAPAEAEKKSWQGGPLGTPPGGRLSLPFRALFRALQQPKNVWVG
jgi:hypothetical protein